MDLTIPDCRLCSQPYNSNLMYVRCEACQHWFHVDAVELDESKIFEVVGFKCCKCYRLRSPICPYLPPEKKVAMEKKMMKKVPKQEISRMDSDFSIISAQGKEEDSFSPLVEWDVSNGGFDEAMTIDYDCLGFADTEFEPQTYFSFNEMLDSKDAGGSNGAEISEFPIENWENPSTILQNEALKISYDNEEPMITIDTDLHIPCKICSHTDPFLDLSCQICGICIHSRCSPWDQQLPQEGDWQLHSKFEYASHL